MSEKQIKALILKWFRSVKKAAGPILPDGRRSRPFDNSLELDRLKIYDDSLLVTLRCGTQIMVSRPCDVRLDESVLVFEKFEQACWRDPGRELRYVSGQIRFVPYPNL